MNRRSFLKAASLLSLVSAGTMVPSLTISAADTNKVKLHSFKIGCAGYTFVKYNLDDALKIMDRLNVRYMSLKDFHLPINADDQKISEVLEKFKARKVTPYCVGPIYMKNKTEVNNAFAYAKRIGVETILAVPQYELLPYVEEKVKEYDIKIAIHIHGPDIKVFPVAEDVWNHVKDLDERLGICYDIGHTVRAGLDLIEDFTKYASRVHDIHIKDVSKNDKSGHCVEGGRGIIDFKAFFNLLDKLNYTGVASIEYEKDMSDIIPGLAETVGCVNACLKFL